MYRTKVFLKGLLVVSIAAMLCGYVLANEQSEEQERDRDRTTQRTEQQTQQRRQEAGAQQAGMLHRTSKLIGKEVKSAQDEDLGSIYDLVLTSDHQQVSYAALSYGGTWGVGAKYFAIPWSALRVGSEGDVTLPISKSQLDQASGFDRNNWPAQPNWQLVSATRQGQTFGQQSQMGTQRQPTGQTGDRTTGGAAQTRPGQTMDTPGTQAGSQRPGTPYTDRDRQMMGRTGTTGTGMGGDETAINRDVQNRRVTNLTGTSVHNAEGEDIGNIEDFVIDASRGQIAYTVVSFGGFWGIGEQYAAVPATAIQIQPRRNVARLDADRETLEKIAFDADDFPDLSNRQYAQQLHETFDAEPYWTVLGFVSPEQEQAATQRAWGAEGQFARRFDIQNVKTVEGTVQSIGTFQPEGATPGVSPGLRIRLTTEDGNLVTVYGGPQWYAQQHDFYVKPGDKISVTGSETKIGWRPVLVASQIQAGDRTLRLRNEQGQPLWQAQQQGAPGQRMGTTPQQRPGQPSQPGTTSPGTQPGTAGQRQPRQGQPDN